MERPNIKDYFAEKGDVKTVHNEYIKSPHLYSYASNLDRYVDYLEDELSERANETETSDKENPKALIIDGVSKSFVCDQEDRKSICNNPMSQECCNKHHKRM